MWKYQIDAANWSRKVQREIKYEKYVYDYQNKTLEYDAPAQSTWDDFKNKQKH